MEEEFDHQNGPLTMKNLPGNPDKGKGQNVTSVSGVQKMSNCFEFDSDTNKEIYSGQQSEEHSPKIVLAKRKKRRHKDMPSGMSDISKTEEGELVSESEFEKMKQERNLDKRITFGFGEQPKPIANIPKISEDSLASGDLGIPKRELTKINEEKNDNSNHNNIVEEENKKVVRKEESEVVKREVKRFVRRGTLETEDLYKSNSVDMSFDMRSRKGHKQSKKSTRKDNVGSLLHGLDSDFETPFKTSNEKIGVPFFGFSAPLNSKNDQNIFKKLANNLQNDQKNVSKKLNKKVDFLERNKQIIRQKSEMVKSQRNIENEKALEMIRKRTQSAHNLLKPRKGRSSLNVMIGNHHSLQSIEKQFVQKVPPRSNEPPRNGNMLGNTLDSGLNEKLQRKGNLDMKPSLSLMNKMEIKSEKSNFESNQAVKGMVVGSMRGISSSLGNDMRKFSKSSLNMKMNLPKGGKVGGNFEEMRVSEVIGEKLEESEETEKGEEEMKKSKSGMLGVRSSQREETVKIYKRGSKMRKSQHGMDLGGILSGEEEGVGQYRSKSQGESRRRGVVGEGKRASTRKNRIYERESLGNFEKQLYESENLEESKERRRREERRGEEGRNFSKKEVEHKEAIGEQKMIERVIEKNNQMTERTVQKVLEHGEKNTKILKEAFREFLSGFRKVEDSDDEKSPEPEGKSIRRLRMDLKKEKQEREKLEKSVKEMREGKAHMSGGYSTVGNSEDWEKKFRGAQRELADANERARVLQKNTKEVMEELEKLKETIRMHKLVSKEEESSSRQSEQNTHEKLGNELPKYVFIKTVKSRYENDETDKQSSQSGRWENSTKRVTSKFFLDEFGRNPKYLQLEKDNRETVRGRYENKLYKLRGRNTYEMMGGPRKNSYRKKSQRRSKSLLGEGRLREWGRDVESEAYSGGRNFREAIDTLHSETSRDKRDLDLSKALENQLGLANKLIERLEKDSKEKSKKIADFESTLKSKEKEIELLTESLEKAEKIKESVLNAHKMQTERECSIGSRRSGESGLDTQKVFHTFNQKGKMRIYESERLSQKLGEGRKEEGK